MADPVGEDGWLALLDEASRTACDLTQRVAVVELYTQRALVAEPWSMKLWLAYCEWFWSLHTDCQNGDAGWPKEEQEAGKEMFSMAAAIKVWKQGAAATEYRINDSHELWDRWVSIELAHLATDPRREHIERLKEMFFIRLQTPHATWEETSQTFSSFLTKYDLPAWETTMVAITNKSRAAKDLYSNRADHELKLKRAVESGSAEAAKSQMLAYLAWESIQHYKKRKAWEPPSPMVLLVALYERALAGTTLGLDPSVWEEYVIFLTRNKDQAAENQLPPVLSVIPRATNHCPWSGALWARYILSAESESLPFSTMEAIKHRATNTRELDRDGMGSVIEFYTAWAGYLKRLTENAGATEEDRDVADMGLPTALEDVREWGKRVAGRDNWQGDPLFRLEHIFIQHLTRKHAYDEARIQWKNLTHTAAANGYEFWQQYYLWEMVVRGPTGPVTLATDVLAQGVAYRNLDWPEKLIEVYLRHCNNYEQIDTLLKAMGFTNRLARNIANRRKKEAEDAAIAYAQLQPQTEAEPSAEGETSSGASKRKRETAVENLDPGAQKKVKFADEDALREQHLKRDRENTTILIENLPPDVTSTKFRQYLKEYGHLNNITLRTEADKQSTTAMAEFSTHEEAQSALLRDGKYFGDRQIRVTPGTGLTLYVTNYPPTADENYLRKLFKECGEIFSIRWPSLKVNSHRRFCYISFRTVDAAAAATKLDGQSLGGMYKLVAKHSDPPNRQKRQGALAEGREIHVTSIDPSITPDELEKLFSKYGKVERVNLLTKVSGESKGAAFVSFATKEGAAAALDLDKTKLKSRVLNVEMAGATNFKPTATTFSKRSSASPGPAGDYAMSPSPAAAESLNTHAQHTSGGGISNRTLCLMNIPDTVNDARVRALAESYGEILKLSLRLDHQGAIIEYTDAASVGKAALALENHEIVPGRKLRTGGLKDLFAEKEETRSDRIQVGQAKMPAAGFMQPAASVRRPVGPGGRGGLGQKRGLGFGGPKTSGENNTQVNGQQKAEGGAVNKPKSNAEFKAMFMSGGTQ
ncbi:uncharacterized protein L3040_005815 [Drepanopeziza brunnea f. sp. 'multigermtubi']|uniref:U4/U6 snRNA-associated-splicing factor PRP24 n=1 Tax=Marssonina brunnea f. sp. multigermtubi (strain MB_m1) TaxID=1072389 RepID=K1WJB2_MARBU|nr:RNA recognition domain-containing protein [Drepanopeziza brunnea f. sp. 'multigermtubi' MB_m1]EKD12956.1 RNA recognition domain-containing protein [Drepanopeziza brunnea f. sp. 'multigermtubi' MB_m1]KAJ5041267.1 hypothetical protein L3040_005815 [Drepanopeziza brunnea f. sp. 'multigermtubi']